ncbi:HlyIII-domain-containing protein [Wolfiporia cocos MD-104 SS10]|uniref:HlyIII-domain-containing protein n=1 Tax=Wolfiporia cocos (strain MD-104) TaxID=742152 RepID=A0A2H3J1M2_WOLCO|nr:HlyIII-domain-containing protein [Wolfiporia cocos MD-104 SS10]
MNSVADTNELRRRRAPNARRFSTTQTSRSLCQSLPHSLEALDLSHAALTPAIASMRLHLLDLLTDLETRLSVFEYPVSPELLKSRGGSTMDDARVRAKDVLAMLRSIRNDVLSHFPDFSVRSHMPDVDGMRAHLPEARVPNAVRSRLPDLDLSEMRARLDDARARLSDVPQHYINTLADHLQSLQAHLSALELPHSLSLSSLGPYGKVLSDGEDRIEKAAMQVARAIQQSLNGSRLIHYVDLPDQWRNNPFVKHGYRFIPLQEWPRLILSLFALHNETLNIHTHLIPFLAWLLTLFPFSPISSAAVYADPPVLAFTAFALVCLFTSALWHTMAGCAHQRGMELCARIDYVGIGWLISASVGTVVHYGYQCNPTTRSVFLTLCLIMGISGSVLPFTEWFNRYEYRKYRITFFVALAFTSVAPLAHLSYLHSTAQMFAFIRPVVPSLVSYTAGLTFYATHFPECYFSSRWAHWHMLDRFGGGSHAIWHVFIVLAISQHKAAMAVLKGGVGEACW